MVIGHFSRKITKYITMSKFGRISDNVCRNFTAQSDI